jgi:hypothetical protein
MQPEHGARALAPPAERDAAAGGGLAMTRVVAVVGRPGVGKSLVLRMLAERLGWQAFGIDSERARGGAWPSLCRRVAALTAPALVESVLFPAAYRHALARHDAGILVVKCSEPERQRRLSGRPVELAGSRADRYWLSDRRSVDTTSWPDERTLATLCGWARGRRTVEQPRSMAESWL